MNRLFSLCILITLFASFPSHAQFWFLGQNGKNAAPKNPFKAHSSFSFGAGSSTYLGDISPAMTLMDVGGKTLRWNAGVQYTRHFKKHFSIQGSFTYIRIAADDNYFDPAGRFEPSYGRNLHFRTDMQELSLIGIYEILGNEENLPKRRTLSPYVYLGLSGLYFNPTARAKAIYDIDPLSTVPPIQQGWINLKDKQTEAVDYSKITGAVPFGFGLRYKLNQSFDIGFDFGYRIAFSDYLDDVSDNRVNVPAVTSLITDRSSEWYAANTLVDRRPYLLQAAQGNTSGNPPLIAKGSDQYFTTQIRLIYHLKNKIDCPPLPR
ncbi:outer membrane beta-barrel protein [Aquirufa aurantiipilula]|uniref:outer membrane beta-barrel protein n=1 Tax=Aquirufa aurantiipilula TaxID=2696561 RepID=UPI001CAA51F5|nr:outer membrane beta-barrel protein [Aquirufa aurantiipilula]MBZ1325769.1 porin family protein [Aquirufa aurantiipilula]